MEISFRLKERPVPPNLNQKQAVFISVAIRHATAVLIRLSDDFF
jgi:hypothetical protein